MTTRESSVGGNDDSPRCVLVRFEDRMVGSKNAVNLFLASDSLVPVRSYVAVVVVMYERIRLSNGSYHSVPLID